MIQSEVTEQIKKLPNPATRLLVYILIIAVVTLFSLYVKKGDGNEQNCKNENQRLREEGLIKDRKFDSLQYQRWRDKSETVEELRNVLKGQDSLINILKKIQ